MSEMIWHRRPWINRALLASITSALTGFSSDGHARMCCGTKCFFESPDYVGIQYSELSKNAAGLSLLRAKVESNQATKAVAEREVMLVRVTETLAGVNITADEYRVSFQNAKVCKQSSIEDVDRDWFLIGSVDQGGELQVMPVSLGGRF